MTQILAAGTSLLGRYTVRRYINSGSMQEVYECWDGALARLVALKVPKGGVADRRFQRGAEMSAKVNHHNVATTFDYFEGTDITFLVEELVDGRDLGEMLDKVFLHLDPNLAAHVIHNICRALHVAHQAGICHRDLKPSNVMTSGDPGLQVIKLTDFGIAKLAENEIDFEMRLFEKDNETLTTSSTLLGAIPYMAPECWEHWREAGQPMDVWALGCIAYQLISGKLPFGSGRGAIYRITQIQQRGEVELAKPAWFGKSIALRQLETDIWELILDCLQLDPAKRPSASDALQRCGTWCYSSAPRIFGSIQTYGERYAGGGKSKSGTIRSLSGGESWFYHLSEFSGPGLPLVGQQVAVSVFPGQPYQRASPVLPLR